MHDGYGDGWWVKLADGWVFEHYEADNGPVGVFQMNDKPLLAGTPEKPKPGAYVNFHPTAPPPEEPPDVIVYGTDPAVPGAYVMMKTGKQKLVNKLCPKGDGCALNDGAKHCFHCGRTWPPPDTWVDEAQALPSDMGPIVKSAIDVSNSLLAFVSSNVKTAGKPLTQEDFYKALEKTIMAPPPEYPPSPHIKGAYEDALTDTLVLDEGRCQVCGLFEDEDGANHFLHGDTPPYGWKPKPGIHGAHYFSQHVITGTAAMHAKAMSEKIKQELIAHIEKHVIGTKVWNSETFEELRAVVWQKSGGKLTLKDVSFSQDLYGTEVSVELIEVGKSEMQTTKLAFPMVTMQSYPAMDEQIAKDIKTSDMIAGLMKHFGVHGFDKDE